MVQTCFFFPLTELEYWIQLAISRIVRKLRPGTQVVLLRPDHPRLRGRYRESAARNFDVVVELPWPQVTRYWAREIGVSRKFLRCLDNIALPEGATLFGCGMGELVHLLLCRRLRGRRGLIIAGVEPFADVDVAELVADVKGTILRNLYTVPLARAVVVAYMHPKTRSFMHHVTPALYDVQINIEHERPSRVPLAFSGVPFPLGCVEAAEFGECDTMEFPMGSVLVFLNASVARLGICGEEAYWSGVRDLVKALGLAVGPDRVFAKLHPQNDDVGLKWLEGCRFTAVERTISAEHLYVFNRPRLAGVFSGASTALITASWLGIPAFDCSAFMGYDREYLRVYKPYFHHAPQIRTVSSVMEAVGQLAGAAYQQLAPREQCLDQWNRVLTGLEMAAAGTPRP